MSQQPDWAKRRNEGGAWFAHNEQPSTEKLRFRKRTFEGKDHFKTWDFLKDGTPHPNWELEQGGNRFEKPGISRRRKKDTIRPDEERLREQVRREERAKQHTEARRIELAHQQKPHAYKDIISWEEDRLLASSARRPLQQQRPLLKQNREGRVERMSIEKSAEMRSSKNRFFCEPSNNAERQDKLKKGGLYHPRKTSILGNSADHHNTIDSYGVADALSHAVYGGKALKPEWDLRPVSTEEWNHPQWYGQKAHVKSKEPAKQPEAPNWWQVYFQ